MWLDILKGVGSLASAGAQFYGAKEQSKMAKKYYDYQVNRDKLNDQKSALAQSNLDEAIDEVYGTKKKKKDEEAQGVDLSLSYGA